MNISSPNDRPDGPADDTSPVGALVLGIVRLLVDRPDALSLDAVTSDAGTTLQLRVDADDLDRVVGKQGRTARSLRTLLGAIGSKTGQQYSLDVLEAQ